jgi:hypothetical protein
VYTVLTAEFAGTQEGTIHFTYLTEVGGGVAQAGRGLDEHRAQLAAALSGDSAHEARQRRFVEAFVRPHGLDVAATPIFADAVKELARQRAAKAESPSRREPAVAHWAARGLARLLMTTAGRRWVKTAREIEEARLRRTRQRSAMVCGGGFP